MSLHAGLTADRWQSKTLCEQLGNVGSEVARALRAKELGNRERMNGALDRALELLDMTLADPRHQGRRREICRAREVFLDYLLGSNEYGSSAASLDAYFLQFGVAARRRGRVP